MLVDVLYLMQLTHHKRERERERVILEFIEGGIKILEIKEAIPS